jgi:signal transduction histidine kinase
MTANGIQESDLGQELHDLSQPLTRLQWRLELARLTEDDVELGETLSAALGDVGELIERVRAIRRKAEGQQAFTGRAA